MKKAIVFCMNFPDTIDQRRQVSAGWGAPCRWQCKNSLTKWRLTWKEHTNNLFFVSFDDIEFYLGPNNTVYIGSKILPTLEIRSTYFVDMKWKIWPPQRGREWEFRSFRPKTTPPLVLSPQRRFDPCRFAPLVVCFPPPPPPHPTSHFSLLVISPLVYLKRNAAENLQSLHLINRVRIPKLL